MGSHEEETAEHLVASYKSKASGSMKELGRTFFRSNTNSNEGSALKLFQPTSAGLINQSMLNRDSRHPQPPSSEILKPPPSPTTRNHPSAFLLRPRSTSSSGNLRDEAATPLLHHIPVLPARLEDYTRSRFLKGLIFERELTTTEEKLLALCEASARVHGFDRLLAYLSGIPEEVLRRQAKLKETAKAVGITTKELFQFLHFLIYIRKISLHQNVAKDQINDIIIAGNAILLRVEDIFNGSEIQAADGVRLNGIFGKQGVVKRDQDIKDIDDLMPFLYILNHTIQKGNPLPAYFLFFGETPNPVTSWVQKDRTSLILESNSGPWFNANIALNRCEKFFDEAVGMSLDVTPLGIIVVDHQGKPQFLPVITAIYDLENMTLWRVERSDSHVFAQRLDVWLHQHLDASIYEGLPLFRRKDIIHKHIERLIAHSNHGSEHMQLRHSQDKKVGCVDGRQDNHKSEIGSLIGERQLVNLLTDPKTLHIAIVFHTVCGYILTAMTLHKLFRALQEGIHQDDTITLGRVRLFINTLMMKPWVKRHKDSFSELMSHVDFKKISATPEEINNIYNLMEDLITDSQGTLRYATSHMNDRGVFSVVNGFPRMIAAHNVEMALLKHKIQDTVPNELKTELIIEELMRLDRKTKTQFVEKNKGWITEMRFASELADIEWMMEDLVTGRYFEVNPKFILEQTQEEILSLDRKDAKTGKIFHLPLSGSVH